MVDGGVQRSIMSVRTKNFQPVAKVYEGVIGCRISLNRLYRGDKMLNYKNNPIFSKEPYYDEDSNVCVLLSEKAIFSPLGRIDRRAFVLLILIDILIYLASLCLLTIWDSLTGFKTIDNQLMSAIYFLVGNYLLFVLINKRIHDIGMPMGLSLLCIVPICFSALNNEFPVVTLLIAIVTIILASIPGAKQDNAYGSRVKSVKLSSDHEAKGENNKTVECNNTSFNYKGECSGIGFKIAYSINLIGTTIVNSKIYCILRNNKKKASLSLAVVILVGCAGYYIYIPKMSDVERYKNNNDVVAMSNLIDKAISFGERDPKYKAVRDQAIIALADMNKPEGNKFLEAYLYSDDQKIELDLKKAIVQAFLANNEKALLEKYLYSDGQKTQLDLKKEIFQGLLVANGDFLNIYINTCLQNTKKERLQVYDELLYVARNDDFKNDDFVERKIAMDIIDNMQGMFMNKAYLDLIKKNHFKCAEAANGNDAFSYLLSSYINSYGELERFDSNRAKEIDKQIEDIGEERRQLEFYFRNVDEYTRRMVRELYVTQGINKALEYHNQVSKDAIDKVNRYCKLESELEKLNYQKKNLGNERRNLLYKQELYYKKLKEYISDTPEKFVEKNRYIGEIAKGLAGSNANLPKDLLGVNWDDPSAYISKLKFELRSDGGLLVYRDSNAKAVPLRFTDCLPDSIDVLSSRFVLNKKGNKIVSIEIECSSNDWNTIYKYLSDKYGSISSTLDEASKTRYRSVWLGYDKAIDLIYYKDTSKLRLQCHDKETLFSS